MIEIAMTFALGFLSASLAWLLILPVLDRRASRLARRRIDGLFPVSMQEIAAERDALRAEFAVAQRRLERRVEAAGTRALAERQAAGARVLEIAAMAREVEGRDAALARSRGETDEALARIAGLDRDLSTARDEGAAGIAALTALEDAHREILTDLKTVRRERDSIRVDLDDALGRAEADSPGGSPNGTEPTAAPETPALTDLRARCVALQGERDVLAASLRAAEEALAGGGAERDAREAADLRRRIDEVADALTGRERLPAVGAFPLPAAARA